MDLVIAAHQTIVAILQAAFPASDQPTSFASKFLWPDAPDLVPIYDGRGANHSWAHRSDFSAVAQQLRTKMSTSHPNTVYFEHALRYLATHEVLVNTIPQVSVPITMKGIDHMYWLG